MPPIFLLGEAWGDQEAKLGQAFVGPTGAFLIKLLSDAKLFTFTKADRYLYDKFYKTQNPQWLAQIWQGHPELYRSNVFNTHPPNNDLAHFCGPKSTAILGYPPLLKGASGYVREEFQPELDRLADELLTVDPNAIIGLGGTPLWALCGRTGIKNWRGAVVVSSHCATGFKYLPTYHPAYVLRDYQTRPIVIADLAKAKHEATYPDLRRPQREIWIEPDLSDIERFIKDIIYQRRHLPLSTDIETAGSRITCIGWGYSDVACVIPFDDSRRAGRSYWPTVEAERSCWYLVRGVLEDGAIPKLFQNGLYDIAFLWRSMRIKVLGAEHDTMLLHHSLQPEMEKNLGFLGSLYTDECRWKNLNVRSQTIKGDA